MLFHEAFVDGMLNRHVQTDVRLPVCSEAERVFSCQNRIKSRLRTRLTIEHLDQLMRLSYAKKPATDFNFSAAAVSVAGSQVPVGESRIVLFVESHHNHCFTLLELSIYTL